MVYLVLAIISSSLISILMRVSEKYRKSGMATLAMNYLMCCLMALMYAGPAQLFPAGSGLTLALGAVNGLLYLGGFALLQWNIAKNGVVLPSTFMKLGVLVPTVMAIVIFGENPRATQIIGLAAAICAIFMMQGDAKAEKSGKKNLAGLLVLLFTGGLADGMSKVYEETGSAALKNHFLLYTFVIALVLCILLCLLRGQKPSPMDVAFGLLIGIPNYFSTRFLLLSLQHVPAVVAFPSFSVGTIVLVALTGVLVFKEKLSHRKRIALGVILVSLVLLNL